MSPNRRSQTGYKGVWLRPSGWYAAELQRSGVRYWLGTFATANLAARAYDIAGWRLGIPRSKHNFLEIETYVHAVHVGPPVKKMKTRAVTTKKELTIEAETDEEATARFARENPTYVRYKQEFFWKRGLERKRMDSGAGPSTVKVKKEDEPGPPTVITVDSSSSSFDWSSDSSSSGSWFDL